jgi:hypothetical protein
MLAPEARNRAPLPGIHHANRRPEQGRECDGVADDGAAPDFCAPSIVIIDAAAIVAQERQRPHTMDQMTRNALLFALALSVVAGACRSTPSASPVSADAWAVVDGREIKRDDVEKAYRRTAQLSPAPSEDEALAPSSPSSTSSSSRTCCSPRGVN